MAVETVAHRGTFCEQRLQPQWAWHEHIYALMIAYSRCVCLFCSCCCVVPSSRNGNPVLLEVTLSAVQAQEGLFWPEQTDLLCPMLGSRISAAHLPQGRCRTPLYVLSFPLLTTRSSATGLPDNKVEASYCASLPLSPVLGSCVSRCEGCKG